MEFGIFAQLFVPRFERDIDPDAEHKRIMRNVEISLAAERAGLKYVWCPEHHFLDEYSHMPGPEVFLSYVGAADRTHPSRLGDLQHHASGEQAGACRRDRRAHGPPARQPLRVRHRARLVDHRGVRLRHPRSLAHQGDVARDDHRDPEDVEGRHVQLRGQVLPHARTGGLPEATRPGASRDVGRRRLARRRSARPARWGSVRSASPRARRARSSRS